MVRVVEAVSKRGDVAGHVFISYVREDSHQVDLLHRTLKAARIPVWRDAADLWPGEDWRGEIRRAITGDALVFIACFSRASLARDSSYQNEELTLAIEQMRFRRPGKPWLIPVRFDECEIPDWDIGGGRTLTSIQHVDLFGDLSGDATARLVEAVLRILGRHLEAGACRHEEPSPAGAAQAPLQPGFAVTLSAGHTSAVNSVAFSPSGTLLASGGHDCKIRFWDVAAGRGTGKRIRSFVIVHSVAFSPDGTILASCGRGSKIWLYDVGTGQKTRTLAVRPGIGLLGDLWAVAFSPDGTTLASAGSRGIRLWDVAAGRVAATFPGHAGTSVAFSAEGTLLAGGQDKTIRIWDVETGRDFGAFTGHTGAVQSVAFSPDGTILASGGDSTIRIWEVRTGRNIHTLHGVIGNRLFNSVRSVSFSPDGTALASCSNNHVLLWDAENGRRIATLTGHTGAVQSVAFSPQGSLLASGSVDKAIRLWKV